MNSIGKIVILLGASILAVDYLDKRKKQKEFEEYLRVINASEKTKIGFKND
jgi:hypothetical protein